MTRTNIYIIFSGEHPLFFFLLQILWFYFN